MSRLLIGIDPGVGGALALLGLEEGRAPQLLALLRMPTVKLGKSTRVDGAAIRHWLSREIPQGADVHAYIEQVGSMPGQGVASMFTFGHAAGVVEGVITGLLIPHTKIPPVTWKRLAGLVGEDKDAARSRAIQLWPHWQQLGKKMEGQACADAALIALYGAQRANNREETEA